MLTALIVDDEPLARMRAQALLEACPDPVCSVAGEAEDGAQALAWLQQRRCDLVLLDIAMPGVDGLALARQIAQLPQPPAVVFTTAHAEHALQAFELAATDYLTKPIRRERLQAALQRVAARRAERAALRSAAEAGGAEPEVQDGAQDGSDGVLSITDRGRTLRLPLREVLYLKAELKYVTLHTGQRQWVLDESLSELEPRLGPGFIRIHRNAIVGLHAVRALERRADEEDGAEGWAVQLCEDAGSEWLAVSRRQVAAVREALAQR
jgi:two-component system response regulator AlgR